MVDWQPLAASTFYLGPMRNTEKVGLAAAEFIDFLGAKTGLKTENIHFLGTYYLASLLCTIISYLLSLDYN